MIRSLVFSVVYIVTGFALAGCISFGREYPEVREYTMDVAREGAEAQAIPDSVLLMQSFNVSPAYARKSFIVRDGRVVREDYYNEFAVNPEELVQEATMGWLDSAGFAGEVVTTDSLLAPTHILRGRLVAIHWEKGDKYKATLKVYYRLIDVRDGRAKIVISKLYTAEEECAENNPEEMVEAMEKALVRILQDFETDLAPMMK